MSKPMRVFHLIQQAHTALFRAADHSMRSAEGITAAQSTVLFLLSENDGQKISDIAKRLGMSKSSLTALIGRMEYAGLVRRERNLDDERISNIFIEPVGEAVAGKTISTVREINAGLLEPFSAAERKTIEKFLIHMRENASSIITEATKSPNPEEE